MNKLEKRASEIDEIIESGISEKITLEDAAKIVSVWGKFLEQCSFLVFLFGNDIPESVLPFKKDILVGALNKLILFHKNNGNNENAKKLEETLLGLIAYTNDEEAIMEAEKNFNNPDWREAMLPALEGYQESLASDGFVIDGKIWKFKM